MWTSTPYDDRFVAYREVVGVIVTDQEFLAVLIASASGEETIELLELAPPSGRVQYENRQRISHGSLIVNDRVILTAVSPNMWHDYLVFYDSIRRFHDFPIYLICLEMVDWQMEALDKHQNIHILTISADLQEEYKRTDPHWRQWFKPFYFDLLSGDKTVLWLDLDIVILESLEPLFEKAEETFFVVNDYFAPKTCLNSQKLYEKFKLDIPKDKANIVLNSGVIGLQLNRTRDREIVELWRQKVNMAASDKEIRSWLALYDQGALLWALQELGYYDLIVPKKDWNRPAVKNPYELVTDSIKLDMIQFLPHGDSIIPAEDIIARIKADNPGAVAVHFAGLPKLAHLCEPNHVHSLTYFRRKNGGKESRRVFVTGLERAGMASVAEIFRQSCLTESWVRHGLRPTLAAEAQAKHMGHDYETYEFTERLKLYVRQDCGFICEANKNIVFFMREIFNRSNGVARFIIMLRDPVDLIRSRMLNFVTWPDELHTTPIYYQEDYRKHVCDGADLTNNRHRLRPHEPMVDLMDLHIWEIEHTIQTVMDSIKTLPEYSYKLVWVENLRTETFHLTQFAGGQKLDPRIADQVAKTKYGVGPKTQSPETIKWVDAQLDGRIKEIYDRISKIVNVPYRGV